MEVKNHVEHLFAPDKGDVKNLMMLGELNKIFTPNAPDDKSIRNYLKTHLAVDVIKIPLEKTYFFEYKNSTSTSTLKKKIFNHRGTDKECAPPTTSKKHKI